MIPFYGIHREHRALRQIYRNAIDEVMASGKMLGGPYTEELERNLGRMTSSETKKRHAVCVASGTDALYFSLKAAGIGPGDSVLVTDFSFIASASCILRAGATPIFIDINDNCLMNIDLCVADKNFEKAKAMIFVDIFGICPNFKEVEDFCRQFSICLIEDACQSFGGRSGNRPAGNMGAFSCISFDPTKVVSAPGNGGAVLCSEEDAELITEMQYKSPSGHNSRISEINAAIVSLKLFHMKSWIEKRKEIARYLAKRKGTEALDDNPYQKLPITSNNRPKVIEALQKADIEYMIHYPRPLHKELGLNAYSPNTAEICNHILSLPIHPWLTDDEVEHIAKTVESL